jgi:hypothetical protein
MGGKDTASAGWLKVFFYCKDGYDFEGRMM